MNQMTVPGFLRGYAPRRGRLGAPPLDVFTSLATAQQQWVLSALAAWLGSPGTQGWYNLNSGSCPGVTSGMDLTNPKQRGDVVACFQAYYNAQNGQGGVITTDGTLDAMTLAALMVTMANAGPACPSNCVPPVAPTPAPTAAPAATSYTAYYVVGGIAVAALAGGIWYAMRAKPAHHALAAGAL